jgi:hypothetical protein
MTRTFKLKPTTVHERFGDETVIMDLATGNYYSAQGAAAAIWTMVEQGSPEITILRRMKAEFAGDQDEIARETAKFLDQLVAEALVDIGSTDASDGPAGAPLNGAPPKPFSAPLLQKYTDMEEMLLLDPIHEVDEHGWPNARKAQD